MFNRTTTHALCFCAWHDRKTGSRFSDHALTTKNYNFRRALRSLNSIVQVNFADSFTVR